MSGIEIISVIIGMIPLIIEAYDHSDSMLRRVSSLTTDGFLREITTLTIKFNNQKAIFRAVATKVLSAIKEDSNGVIGRLEFHLLQRIRDLDIDSDGQEENDKLDTLNELFKSCEQTLREMSEQLSAIRSALKPFEEDERNHQRTIIDFTLRIKLAWRQLKIQQKIDAFVELNTVLGMIVNEIIQHLRGNQAQPPWKCAANILGIRSQPSKMYAYRNIQHASLRLYKTISEKWCCGLHEQHVVHLSNAQFNQRGRMSPVSFATMVTGIDDDSTRPYNLKVEIQDDQGRMAAEYLKLDTEDVPGDNIEIMRNQNMLRPEMWPQVSTLDSLTPSLQEISQGGFMEITKNEKKKLKRRPKFNPMHDNIPLDRLSLGGTSAQEQILYRAPDTTTDLEDIPDHCCHLREQGSCCPEKTCIGYLADQCIVRFYLQPVRSDINGQFLSIADLVRQTSENSLIQVLSQSETVSLASSIADAVLQFYSSPWLSERWDSKDIHIEANAQSEAQKPAKIHPLYVSLKFGERSKGKGVMGLNRKPLGEHIPAVCITQGFSTGVRNERLFCLGIVLLELGYTKPWDVLRANMMERLPEYQRSDYFIAESLARRLVSHMGLSYVRIVRKCIGCDFGLGETDLGDEELQKKFAEDVIETLRAVGAGLSIL